VQFQKLCGTYVASDMCHVCPVARTPECTKDFAKRVRILEELTVNSYTPLKNGNISSPLIIGLRVVANVAQGSGFKLGYKFSQAHAKCRPGSMIDTTQNFLASTPETTADLKCVLCPPGKFTPTDQSTYCFECPLGTYVNGTGATRCLPCPAGHSTIQRGTTSVSQCRAYCRAGSYSNTGREPCTLCPRNTGQDKVGATFCKPCPPGSITFGQTGSGYTLVDPWTCVQSADVIFTIERTKVIGQQISFTITWKLPESQIHVNDLIVIFKGEPWQNLRQLSWAYASAVATNSEVLCGLYVDDACLKPGPSTKPWASITMEVDSAGVGIYSAVYYSYKKEIRMLASIWNCTVGVCPKDLGLWETDTGLYVCKPGQYSASATGGGPCIHCPPGTFSDSYASLNCTACAKVIYCM
jgi:hypothetical protein